MKKTIIIFVSMIMMTGIQSALAHGDGQHHMDSGMHHQENMSQMKEGFLTTKNIDGYNVSFHIMKAPAGKDQAGSHHVMVKFEKDGKALTNLVANSKAVHPNGKSESKMLMKMGNWYMAAYNLDHKGNHQVMVLFKTADGVKHFGGIDFPEKEKD